MRVRSACMPFLVVCAACGGDPVVTPDIADTAEPDQQIACLGNPCTTVDECKVSGPCLTAVTCADGCCLYQFRPEGTPCSEGCSVGGKCAANGECIDTAPVACVEADGNPCTAPSCDPATGECGAEIPLPDGPAPLESTCWDNMLCNAGEVDNAQAVPSALAEQCTAQDDALDPFGCVESVVCVDSQDACVVQLKAAGTQCWGGSNGGQGDTCPGRSCDEKGECVEDAGFDTVCDDSAYPVECGDDCRPCTDLVCHWIADPDAGTTPTKKVKYCRPEAVPGEPCDDGSGKTVGDECVLSGQANGPMGKETLGSCLPGEGKTKDECLEEMDKAALPCLKAGITCDEDSGCAFDQGAADAWCYPPAPVCFNQVQTFCTQVDLGDGKWNSESGCHLVVFSQEGCDDANPCTQDSCDTGSGCKHVPQDGPVCDDGSDITVDDVCKSGACVGLPDPDVDGVANSGYSQPCGKGVADLCNDNCPLVANPDQADADGDGVGDVCECVPQCAGKSCGSDGCGGSCGSCPPSHVCLADGKCQCIPDCVAKQCGPDGCGGNCGSCPNNNVCLADGTCMCIPDCTNKQCGDNGCGGNCGSCPGGYLCIGNQCTCTPNCGGKQCGDNGCGGSCGMCGGGQLCSNGTCVNNCTPVNGGWSGWSCGVCDKQCGGGKRTCTRTCSNPAPSCQGAYCVGSDFQSEDCNTQPCKPTVCGNMTQWQECTVAEYVSGIHGDDTSKEACALSCGQMQALCAKYIWYSDDPETGAVCVCHSAHGTGPSTFPFEQNNQFGWKIWAAECY